MGEASDRNAPIAIVGMACRFAGCPDLRSFWVRILSGAPAFSDYPDPEATRYLNAPEGEFASVTTLRGGYLRELWQASASSLSLPATALAGTNPEFSLVADLVGTALRNAGEKARNVPRDRVGIVLGYAPHMDPAAVNWCQLGLVVDQTIDLARRSFPHGSTEEFESLRKSLLASLPQYDSRNIHALFCHSIATLTARRYDFSGPSYCINDGESSGLIAAQAACDELRSGRVDMAITGAVQGLVTPQFMMPFSRMGALSSSEVPHPFGRGADGTLLGEGGAILVLRRLDDAVRDGDRVFALIRAVGSASDGPQAKPGESLAAAARNACDQSGIPFRTLTLIEGHGSGVPAEDRMEVKMLASLYDEFTPSDVGTVALGSAKALIGDCCTASGMAGFVKTAMSLHRRIVPPSQEAEHPSEQLHLGETPFFLNLSPRPWVHNNAGLPRRAGVSSLTLCGGSAFAILEQFRGRDEP